MKNTSLNIHADFIKSPITDALKNVVSASAGVGSGIETFPICDYIMQSVFLKMTGFQEQKLKCICWELATVDFEYRYDRETKPVGERSSYKDKQPVYKDLIDQIRKRSTTFNMPDGIDKDTILKKTFDEVKITFENTNLAIWSQKNFNEFETIWSEIEEKHFASDNSNLFSSNGTGICLQKIYKNHLYKHRNRIAHNTQSYQQNLPTLKTLVNESYKYENYFVYFAILVLIDKIFIALYEKYLLAIEDN